MNVDSRRKSFAAPFNLNRFTSDLAENYFLIRGIDLCGAPLKNQNIKIRIALVAKLDPELLQQISIKTTESDQKLNIFNMGVGRFLQRGH